MPAPDIGRFVKYSAGDGVSVVTLDRQPVNAYDAAFHFEFQTAWQTARDDPDTRAIVMQATGRHFCVGVNIKDPEPLPAGAVKLSPPEEIRLIKETMKPTIAAVQGGCIGGGQRMVWPCDLIFCTEDAFFMDPTAAMGIGGIQSHLHTWFYGPRLAKEMIYSGEPIPAARLHAMGQVNRLYPDLESLHEAALVFGRSVASKDPVALRQAKRASDTTMDIMGQHYVLSRMGELLDDPPTFAIPSPDQARP